MNNFMINIGGNRRRSLGYIPEKKELAGRSFYKTGNCFYSSTTSELRGCPIKRLANWAKRGVKSVVR
jgi:hypothetical protein